MTEHVRPNMNPADDGTLRGMINVVLEAFAKNIDNMIPARVVSFDRETNTATIKPMIRVIKTDGRTVSRTEINNIPVFQMSGGGCVINFPLKQGDLGWLHANDRDISTFLQNLSESQPNTLRKHTFEQGVFYPDVMRGWSIAEENEAATVIQTLDGSQCISIHADHINIKATEITLETPIVNTTGHMNVTGNIVAEGEISTNLGGGINLSTHFHTNVENGPDNSGGPI